jgi:lactoylglutathione lyase
MFRKVSAIVLLVQNFEKSLTFYRDVLGLEVGQLEANFAAFKMEGHDFALQQISDAVGMFNVNAEEQRMGADRVILCAGVENVDGAYETLNAKGVEFIKPPIDQAWGIRAAYFRDPEGNLWEIAQPISS